MSITLQVRCHLEIESLTDCHCIAMLRPRSGMAQWLSQETYHFSPSVRTTEYVDHFGNLCQRFVAPQGPLSIDVEAVVETDDLIDTPFNAPPTPIEQLPDAVMEFLLPSRYCPIEKLGDWALEIAGHYIPGSAQVETIRSWIHHNITYEYGQSDVTTDALDTLNGRAGVCRDFAHIGIALCRSLLIPARMVVGYLHELNPMDLHAWFEAYIDGRWYTFDATQAETRGARVILAYGRDAADVAFLTSYGQVMTTNMLITVSRFNAPASMPIQPHNKWLP